MYTIGVHYHFVLSLRGPSDNEMPATNSTCTCRHAPLRREVIAPKYTHHVQTPTQWLVTTPPSPPPSVPIPRRPHSIQTLVISTYHI